MKLTRYESPFARTFGADVDRLFGGSPFAGFDRLFEASPRAVYANSIADLYEDEAAFYAKVDLPGVKREDLSIELDRDRLVIALDKASEGEDEPRQSWRRTLAVPENTQAEGVSAKLEDGVLTVTLPKADEPKSLKIEVK